MRRALILMALLAATAAEAQRADLRATRPNMTPLALQARFEAEHWRIVVLEGGIESQRISVQSDLPGMQPRLADADGDGAPDLWVPVIGGNVNTAWDLWLMRPAEARFVRAGEVNGLGFSRDRGGMLVALVREGCCATTLTWHRFRADGGLVAVFAVGRSEGFGRAAACQGSAITQEPPAATVRAACGLEPGRLPGRRLPVP